MLPSDDMKTEKVNFDRTIRRQTVHLVHADFVMNRSIERGANKIEGFTEYHRIN